MSSIVKKRQPSKPPSNQQHITSARWQGPLPPPAALQQFDQILDGGAERIFKMAEAEQKHRIESEREALFANIKAQQIEGRAIKRGHYLGAALSVVATIAAVVSAHIGAHPSVSIALIGVPLMSAVRAIILRK